MTLNHQMLPYQVHLWQFSSIYSTDNDMLANSEFDTNTMTDENNEGQSLIESKVASLISKKHERLSTLSFVFWLQRDCQMACIASRVRKIRFFYSQWYDVFFLREIQLIYSGQLICKDNCNGDFFMLTSTVVLNKIMFVQLL